MTASQPSKAKPTAQAVAPWSLARATDSTTSCTLRTEKRLQVACCFLNYIPPLPQMLFCSEHVPKANSHYCSAAQFCLREIRAPRRVNSLYNIAVQLVD